MQRLNRSRFEVRMSLLLATRAIVSSPGEEWSADLDGLFIQQVPLKKKAKPSMEKEAKEVMWLVDFQR